MPERREEGGVASSYVRQRILKWTEGQSDHDELPFYSRHPFPDLQPCETGGSAAIGAADATGVEHAGGAEHLIAGNVGVAVEEIIRTADEMGRDMDEEKRPAATLKKQPVGQIEIPVIITQDGINRWADGLYRLQDGKVAKIAEMPDLIRLSQA